MSIAAVASAAFQAFGSAAGGSAASPGVVSTSSNPEFSSGSFGTSGQDKTITLAILALGVVIAIKLLK